MSWHLAPGLGPLLLATEAQTRSLWLFLGRAAEVKVKLTWQICWWHCWRLFRNSRTLYRPSQPRPKPPASYAWTASISSLTPCVRSASLAGSTRSGYGRARVAFLSYVWCGTTSTLCFHGVRDTLCI